jgi:predicted DsbA family dithiol-disulfide isomerase
MQIDIVCDVTCPWSFIGKRQLEEALAKRPEIRAEITWRAFQLNPDLPPDGMDRELYLAAKFGSLVEAKRVYAVIARAGTAAGIPFAFDRIRRTPNTRDAHRLIRYSAPRGKGTTTVESLFCAYFIEARDIGDRATLTQIACEIGLGAAEIQNVLESAAEIDPVLADDRDATRSGIGAVPSFIFNRRHAVSGAHSPEIFLQILDEAEKDAPRTS